MEDIDKNGDGFIDLEEYIGETPAPRLCRRVPSSPRPTGAAAGLCAFPLPPPPGILLSLFAS